MIFRGCVALFIKSKEYEKTGLIKKSVIAWLHKALISIMAMQS